MNSNNINKEYNLIDRFFKTTTEPYDYLDYGGKKLGLKVWLDSEIIEFYSYKDLKAIIENF